ncbi:hypothetical protein [Vibrio mexicanus]|uniref:hypothetical protein n=1 Tax=Vibrio mexicanus TaxID=1004326 RepID=UPI001EE37698|nr:hypothetical protein [Vibrio mexicanus]
MNTLKFVLIANLIAGAVVFGVEKSTGFFGFESWSDYTFFVSIAIWGVAALFFMYPPGGGFGGDKADIAADSMVDSIVANEIDDDRMSDNTRFCIKLVLAGLPAFAICVFPMIFG